MASIIDFFKGVFQKMFKKDDIKKAFGTNVAISQMMIDKISQWHDMYCGKAPWVDGDSVISLRLEQAITREFANIALNEMTAKVTNDKLDKIFKIAIKDINERLQRGLAMGAMVIKPLGGSSVQYVAQNAFIPIEYDSDGMLIKVIFPEVKKVSDNKYHIRLEYHCLDNKGMTISNKAYTSNSPNSLGQEIPLDMVEDWANLEPSVTYPLMTRQAFGYYRNPIDNAIDGSFCGVSVFDNATEIIKMADIQFGRLDWEFESAERAIHVDDVALQIDKNKKSFTMQKRNKRLYRGLNLDTKNGELLKEFSPQLREDSYITGLEEYKRNIEFDVGLSYGDISNPAYVEKTATEVKSAKKRKYNTVSAIQNNLKECLDGLAYALAFYNAMATTNYEFICDFKDSILVDESEERKQDLQDVSIGAMRLEEYRAKWYGETIEEAIKNLPQQAEVME